MIRRRMWDHVARIEGIFAVMRNGEKVEISRRRRKDFLQKYMEYSMRFL